jgi:hypothetical protein
MRVDDRGNSVGRIMEAIDKLEAQGEQESQSQKDPGTDSDRGCVSK